MLCKKVDRLPLGAEWAMELKLDGWRAVATKEGPGSVRLHTRSGNQIQSVPYLCGALDHVIPNRTVLDGEIFDPTSLRNGWNRVQSICSLEVSVHVPSAASPALAMCVFDVMELMGSDVTSMTLRDRRTLMERFVPARSDGAVQLIEQMRPTVEKLDELLEAGHEGVVVKRLDSTYRAGRGRDWVKVKPAVDEEMDVMVVACPLDGNGKYAGQVGAIVFQLPNGKLGRASGMDDSERYDMSVNPTNWIGKTIEIRHWGVTVTGSLRHPVFSRLRHDLS